MADDTPKSTESVSSEQLLTLEGATYTELLGLALSRVETLKQLPVGYPHSPMEVAKAELQLTLAALLQGTMHTSMGKLEGAVDRLVTSSNDNTQKMSELTARYVSLQRRVVWLTVAAVGAAVIQAVAAIFSATRPVTPAPAPIVNVQPAITLPAPVTPPPPAPMPKKGAK